MRYLFGGLAVLVPMALVSAQTRVAPAPPEIERTVAALTGTWALTAVDKAPGASKKLTFPVTLTCRRTALRAAVDCRFAGRIPQVGPLEASAVIGYSPDERVVRWMEISSTGEYHDHRGTWKGDTLDFEPLSFTVAGDSATEHLYLTFPSAGRFTLNAVTTTAAGDDSLACTARRLPRTPS